MCGVVTPVRRVSAGARLVGPRVDGDRVEDGRAVDAVTPKRLTQPVDLVRMPEKMFRKESSLRKLKLAELTCAENFKFVKARTD